MRRGWQDVFFIVWGAFCLRGVLARGGFLQKKKKTVFAGGGFLPEVFFFAGGGFLPEVFFCRRFFFAGGVFLPEGFFCRRGFFAGGVFLPEGFFAGGFFCRRRGYVQRGVLSCSQPKIGSFRLPTHCRDVHRKFFWWSLLKLNQNQNFS